MHTNTKPTQHLHMLKILIIITIICSVLLVCVFVCGSSCVCAAHIKEGHLEYNYS